VNKHQWPDVNRVAHGDFTLDLAQDAVRNITFQGAQIIDLLYTAIRPIDWSTLVPDKHTEDIQVIGSDCVITISDSFGTEMLALTKITLTTSNTFLVDYELNGFAEYSLNRWGICFCLDTKDWMGSKVSADGNVYKLDKGISPQRVVNGITQGLFPAASEINFFAPDGRNLNVISTGKVLEAEDQRNWTDNTYKIYSGSLSEPRPFTTSAGSLWKQSAKFEVGAPNSKNFDPSKILVSEIEALPSIGIQFNTEPILASDDLDKAFILLDIDHLRINAESLTSQKIATVSASGLILEAALLSESTDIELQNEVRHLSERVPAGSRLLIQRAGREIVQAEDLPKNESLSNYIPGTDAYLVDLHRNQYEFGNSLSYSMVPTVHTSDTESIFRTLATQTESIIFAKDKLAQQVLVSPITFSTRGNPETGHATDRRINFANPDIASRIRTLSGASWTLGSIFALASAGAFSGTWHELFGEFGIIYRHGSSIRFSPTFHALAALGAHHAHEIKIATSADNSWVAFENAELKKIVIASLRPWPLEITSKVLSGYSTIQSLREDECEKASQIMDWWSYAETTPISSEFPLTLTPFEITVIKG
jgi:hypothetical protein